MTLFPQAIGSIPEETARIARAANPKGTLAMWLRDELGAIYTDAEFADLYPQRGQPALAPWRLAVVTLLQYVEDLTDRQAAEAVRERIDWKYLLGLELSDPGFDPSVLCEWRERLLSQGAEGRLLDKLLAICREHGWLKAGGKMRTDATHVLAAVRSLHHLETVGETLRAVLEELAEVAPDWLLSWLPDAWFKRYEGRMDSRRLPKKAPERQQLAEQIGRDGVQLLKALEQAEAPAAARELESVQVLQLVWPQYYEEREGQVYWRDGPAPGANGLSGRGRSRSRLPRRSVKPVRCAPTVRKGVGGTSNCSPRRSWRPYSGNGRCNRQRRFARRMPYAQGSKPPSRRPHAVCRCARAAIGGCPRCTCRKW